MALKVFDLQCELGHVFEGEGYDTPTDQRYCINSVCLTLEPAQGE